MAELGVAASQPNDLYAKSESLIKHCMPVASASDIHDLIRMRVVEPALESVELLTSEGLSEFLDDETKREVEGFSKTMRAHMQDSRPCKERVKAQGLTLKAIERKPYI
eukprot:9365884-Lingulodinium_polyedra.AAC.1